MSSFKQLTVGCSAKSKHICICLEKVTGWVNLGFRTLWAFIPFQPTTTGHFVWLFYTVINMKCPAASADSTRCRCSSTWHSGAFCFKSQWCGQIHGSRLTVNSHCVHEPTCLNNADCRMLSFGILFLIRSVHILKWNITRNSYTFE